MYYPALISNILAILKNVVGHFSSSWMYCTALILNTLSFPGTGTSLTNNFGHLFQNSDWPSKSPKFYTTTILGKNKLMQKRAYFFQNYICDKRAWNGTKKYFTTKHQMFGKFWKYLEIFGNVWKCLKREMVKNENHSTKKIRLGYLWSKTKSLPWSV